MRYNYFFAPVAGTSLALAALGSFSTVCAAPLVDGTSNHFVRDVAAREVHSKVNIIYFDAKEMEELYGKKPGYKASVCSLTEQEYADDEAKDFVNAAASVLALQKPIEFHPMNKCQFVRDETVWFHVAVEGPGGDKCPNKRCRAVAIPKLRTRRDPPRLGDLNTTATNIIFPPEGGKQNPDTYTRIDFRALDGYW